MCHARRKEEQRPVWPQQRERAMAEAEKAIRAPRPELAELYHQHRKLGESFHAAPPCRGGVAGTQGSHVQAGWGGD